MAIWVITMFFTLLIPGTMVLFGFLWKRRPPKDRNSLYGYRTARSCKSQAAWDFAHRTAGRLWRGWGSAALAVSLAMAGWDFSRLGEPACVDAFCWLSLVLTAAQLAVLIGSIVPVERALKREFDKEGIRKGK